MHVLFDRNHPNSAIFILVIIDKFRYKYIILAKQSFVFQSITSENNVITVSDSYSCPCLQASHRVTLRWKTGYMVMLSNQVLSLT